MGRNGKKWNGHSSVWLSQSPRITVSGQRHITGLSASEPTLDDLPPICRQMAKLVGLEAVSTLIQHHGGTTIHIPDHVPEGHSLIRILGGTAAKKICWHFGGSAWYIPSESAIQQRIEHRKRNEEIIARHRQGESVKALARAYGLSDRRIRAILSNHPLKR